MAKASKTTARKSRKTTSSSRRSPKRASVSRAKPLGEYNKKRDFERTSEPEGIVKTGTGNSFVIQKHAASRLHYDFRLELDGVLKSWAVPKGPSLDPKDKRLAVQVEDHPLDYGGFEGTIPQGEYGGGTVMLWDRGQWTPEEDPRRALAEGKLKFSLEGEKLHGGWMLVRRGGRKAGANETTWFLIKERDPIARSAEEFDITEQAPLSVASGRDLDEIAAGKKGTRTSKVKPPAQAAPAAKSSGNGKARKAPRSKLPETVEPEMATLVKDPPAGDQWLHEMKLDGYRMLCRVEQGQAHFVSRNGKDWTKRFRVLAGAVEKLDVEQTIFDGEVAVLEKDGTTSFQNLQNVLSEDRGQDLVYFVFDLLYLNGEDLRSLPLEDRKARLAELIPQTDRGQVRFVEHIAGNGPEFFRQACRLGLEGIISKRRNRPYRAGRGEDWLKVKCSQREEFVICGYTDPAGARTGFGALLLGYHDDAGQLVYAGRVGTGFTERTLEDLTERLKRLEQKESPLDKRPSVSLGRGIHWVKPQLVAQVEYSNWTRDGILRHPSFQGLREDKAASEVVRDLPLDTNQVAESNGSSSRIRKGRSSKQEKAASPAGTATRQASKATADELAGIRLTSPDKVLYPDQNVTKLELARYYAEIADWMLPHVVDRPLSLVRCPSGRHKACFFQKHADKSVPSALGRIDIREREKIGTYLVARDLAGVISLVQMGVLEIHLWGARTDDIERPDRLVFDLDPDADLPWQQVIEAALHTRQVLDDLGLQSFLKTTGGKGLHVVVPIRRKDPWDDIKQFCRGVAERVAAGAPDRYTTVMSKAARRGKVFLDYLRNDRGATAIAPYSTRSRSGAPVSVPIFWEELGPKVRSDTFTVANLPKRLRGLKADPWEEMSSLKQSITARMKRAVGV